MAVYKIKAKKVVGQEGVSYLYLYKLDTGHKQPELKSLKVKIPTKYWNDTKEKVSNELPDKWLERFKDVTQLNKWLAEQRENLIKANGSFDFIPNDEKSVNDWAEKIINRTKNQGSKMRYTNVKGLLEKFQLYYSVNVLKKAETTKLLFKHITVDWIEYFEKWLLENGNSKNSANYKIKAVKSIINKAHFERWYLFPVNPFDFVKLHFEDTKIELLTIDELKKMITAKFVEVIRRTTGDKWGSEIKNGVEERNKKNKRYIAKHKLEDIRNYWLFQLFSQGIRVSDMVTLRWNDFRLGENGLRIHKRMIKTKHFVSILVNDKMLDIIEIYIIRYYEYFKDEFDKTTNYYSEINKINAELQNENDWEFQLLRGIDDDNLYNQFNKWWEEQPNPEGFGVDGIFITKKSIDELINIDAFVFNDYKTELNLFYNWINPKIEEKRNSLNSAIEQLKKLRFELISSIIIKLSFHKTYKTNFVFKLLSDEIFSNINEENDFSYISEDQYRKFQSARTYYNKLLKLVAIQSDINKNLTSHLARHSYTSLMLELGENVNLFDAMTSLGHKHLTTTQGYLQRFTHKKVDNLNLIISDKLK